MSALWPSIQRGLVWFHRWAGVSLCLLFAAWFASGAVLHFVPFPSLPNRERLARSEPIQLSRLLIAPRTYPTRRLCVWLALWAARFTC
jgi:hypothetical protein